MTFAQEKTPARGWRRAAAAALVLAVAFTAGGCTLDGLLTRIIHGTA